MTLTCRGPPRGQLSFDEAQEAASGLSALTCGEECRPSFPEGQGFLLEELTHAPSQGLAGRQVKRAGFQVTGMGLPENEKALAEVGRTPRPHRQGHAFPIPEDPKSTSSLGGGIPEGPFFILLSNFPAHRDPYSCEVGTGTEVICCHTRTSSALGPLRMVEPKPAPCGALGSLSERQTQTLTHSRGLCLPVLTLGEPLHC